MSAICKIKKKQNKNKLKSKLNKIALFLWQYMALLTQPAGKYFG
jgi:hypothetical protein